MGILLYNIVVLVAERVDLEEGEEVDMEEWVEGGGWVVGKEGMLGWGGEGRLWRRRVSRT